MEPKKVLPVITLGILGAIWIVMTIQKVPVPPMLTQAIVAAAGSIAATQAVGQAQKDKETGSHEPS